MQKIILGIVALAIIAVLLWNFMPKIGDITVESAKGFVLDDLKHKYANAEYEILSVQEENATTSGKQYTVKARVTLNPDSACPERIHLYYNYPAQGYVSQPPDFITKDCQICGGAAECTILYKEEAVIASHTKPGTENVNAFIQQYGAAPTVSRNDATGVWAVVWKSNAATYSYEVKIAGNSAVISVNIGPK